MKGSIDSELRIKTGKHFCVTSFFYIVHQTCERKVELLNDAADIQKRCTFISTDLGKFNKIFLFDFFLFGKDWIHRSRLLILS